MAKRITLPLGLSPADADSVGDHTLVSGRDYDVTKITTTDIRNALGESNNDVGLLCSSPNINEWAAFKPNKGGAALPSGIRDDGATPANIYYDAPAASDGFRMGDFAGYNHNAPVPGTVRSANIPMYNTDPDTVTFGIQLPEFDVRDFDSRIKGTICTVDGVSTYYEFVDLDIGSKTAWCEATINTTLSAATTSFTAVIKLGEMDGTTIVPIYNFPNAGGGELSLTVTAYNVSLPELRVYWNSLGAPAFDCNWAPRDALVTEYFKIDRSESNSPYSWTEVASLTTGTRYVDYDIENTVGKKYWYRLRYKNTIQSELITSPVEVEVGTSL